jgi:hypothetical protein
LILGHSGSAGPITHPTFTPRRTVSRYSWQYSAVTSVTPYCLYGYLCRFGTDRRLQHRAHWSGIVGIGSPGDLSVSSSIRVYYWQGDFATGNLTTHLGNYTGSEISITYAAEPSMLPLAASGFLLAAILAVKRRLRRF